MHDSFEEMPHFKDSVLSVSVYNTFQVERNMLQYMPSLLMGVCCEALTRPPTRGHVDEVPFVFLRNVFWGNDRHLSPVFSAGTNSYTTA